MNFHRPLLLFSLTLLALNTVSCKNKEPQRTEYSVRGTIQTLPTSKRSEIIIHHEKIIGFVSQKGTKADMPSMSMRFGLAKGLNISEIKEQDKVEFKFGVSWTAKPMMEISELRKLPKNTQLVLDGL